jgi:hypothetical protein
MGHQPSVFIADLGAEISEHFGIEFGEWRISITIASVGRINHSDGEIFEVHNIVWNLQ